ncbi:uncharacterized protein LOC103524116 [Trichonephila clavipes]|uniref:Uncharacterized protein LOC103524116 n=1 Tax=Trichonephila clavipes TaxID=2585209 RepID=A0A8X6SIL9_TRICX|nr:uncharacterized protein LOC103524116 [Trichonephila clavipes]
MALRAITVIPGQNIIIFIDCQVAVQTISDYNLYLSELEFECKQLINSFLSIGSEVVLQWILSQFGIHGNEQAGQLVQEPSILHPQFLLEMPRRLSGIKYVIEEYPLVKSWSCLLDGQRRAQLSILLRVERVTCFR